MCGIAGVLALGGRPPERAWGEAMLAAIRHRGPDGEGIFADHRIVLAHARLAIIDTSSGGAQPMRSADGRFAIVQNGEVYNHHELRRTLEAEGATFRTRSDTEVLVELLARRGPSALDDVRGMFAFALYDSATGDLVLARDRLGKKPLVWVRTDEYLAFASEARALLRLPFVRARLDRTRAREFVRFLYVPSPHTALEGVRKLPAAHLLTVRGAAPGVHPEPERWWRLPAPDPAQRADAAWFERLDAELLEATRLRTVSDVPIGVFLSGGVDSTTVLERLHAAGHRPIRTFTVGFRGLPDERAIARASAARYGAEHVELVLEPDLEHDIDAILEHFGEPLGDSAVVTTALIAREAAKYVKVILNGDGGDELFGGYPRYRFARRADLAARFPGGLAALRAVTRPHAARAIDTLARGGPRFAARELGSVTSRERLDALFGPAPPETAELESAAYGLTGALFDWDTGVYLPDDLLLKVDIASMRHALENRSPLLDHRLFEHVARIVPSRRASLTTMKPLLRRLVRDRLPAAPLAAAKQGFQLPIQSWLRGGMRPWLEGLLLDPVATGALYRPGALRAEVEQFLAGRADELAPYRLFGMAALERWARAYDVRADG